MIAADSAGAGDINCTLRVQTTARSVIVKQSRPWVAAQPAIAAAPDRTNVERLFYETIQGVPSIAFRMPRLLASAPALYLLCLEDLGESMDYTELYSGRWLQANEIAELTSFLRDLHGFSLHASLGQFENREMRELNYAGIFVSPLDDRNGVDLDGITPGLASPASELRKDAVFRHAVEAVAVLYFSQGSTLVHGDYFPKNWLSTPDGIKIIDPEFCFAGRAEYDWGVLLAHLYLSGQPEALIDGLNVPGDCRIVRKFAGVEMLGRLLGIAQLPLRAGLEDKIRMIRLCRSFVCSD